MTIWMILSVAAALVVGLFLGVAIGEHNAKMEFLQNLQKMKMEEQMQSYMRNFVAGIRR